MSTNNTLIPALRYYLLSKYNIQTKGMRDNLVLDKAIASGVVFKNAQKDYDLFIEEIKR